MTQTQFLDDFCYQDNERFEPLCAVYNRFIELRKYDQLDNALKKPQGVKWEQALVQEQWYRKAIIDYRCLCLQLDLKPTNSFYYSQF